MNVIVLVGLQDLRDNIVKHAEDSYEGKTILICWEHHKIPEIVKTLGLTDTELNWGSNPFSGVSTKVPAKLSFHDLLILMHKDRSMPEHVSALLQSEQTQASDSHQFVLQSYLFSYPETQKVRHVGDVCCLLCYAGG